MLCIRHQRIHASANVTRGSIHKRLEADWECYRLPPECFHVYGASTTIAAEMRHWHAHGCPGKVIVKVQRRDPSPPTAELRKTIR